MNRTKLLTILCMLVFASAPLSYATPLKPELHTGMNPGTVLSLWGSPDEKQSFESKREELWVYSAGSVRFKNGELSSWHDDERARRDAVRKAREAEVRAEQSESSGDSYVVEEILSELMEGPSEDQSPARKTRNNRRRR